MLNTRLHTQRRIVQLRHEQKDNGRHATRFLSEHGNTSSRLVLPIHCALHLLGESQHRPQILQLLPLGRGHHHGMVR